MVINAEVDPGIKKYDRHARRMTNTETCIKKNHYDISRLIEADPAVASIVFAYEKKCALDYRLSNKAGRTSHGLVYVLGGKALYSFPSCEQHVGKGDIIYLAKDARYEAVSEGETGYHFIVVSFDLVGDLKDRQPDDTVNDQSDSILPLPAGIAAKSANRQYYLEIFRDISEKWYYKGPLYKLKCKALLSEIIYSLVQDTIKGHMHVNGITRILPAVEYMEKCFDREIDIKGLSDITGISVSHFRRLFGRIYGVSPHEYLNGIRIAKAKDMLRSEIFTVSEVAAKTGFKNIYYFSRIFRKITGTPPSEFR